MDFGTASVHSFNEAPVDEAEPPMGRQVNERLAPFQGRDPVHHSTLMNMWGEDD